MDKKVLTLLVLSFLALITSVTSQGCKVRCKHRGYAGILRLGECACSHRYPKHYYKGSHCTIRISLNNHKRVRLDAMPFKIRQTRGGNQEYILLENKMNTKMNKIYWKRKGGYFMRKFWNRKQMVNNRFMIVNTPQARLTFRSSGKGNRRKMKWKVCLKDNISPNLEKLNCSLTMDKMQKGFNRRHADISSNMTQVTEFCCKSTAFNMAKDQAFVMCEEDGYPRNEITSNNEATCVVCSASRERVAVQADVPFPNSNKKIDCTCETRGGAKIGEDCTGGVPCLDLNHNAICDESGTNVCKCPDDMITDPEKTMCGPRANLTEPCSGGQICVTTYGRGFCDGSVCTCPETEEPDPTKMFCTKEVNIGEACLPGYTCNDTKSRATCVSDVCTCPGTSNPNENNTFCEYKSNYGEYCDEDAECIETRAQKCESNLCVCDDPAYSRISNFCYLRNTYNQFCEYSGDCAVTNSQCSGGKCLCKYRYTSTSSTACTPYCWHADNTGKYFAGKIVCNQNNGYCHRCKCEGPPKRLTYKKRVKKPCWKKASDWGCNHRTFKSLWC